MISDEVNWRLVVLEGQGVSKIMNEVSIGFIENKTLQKSLYHSIHNENSRYLEIKAF